MDMHNPVHPGGYLKDAYLEPLKISVTEAAKRLGVSRQAMSEIVNGRSGVSPVMALRLSDAFSTSPEFWMNMQRNRDLWQARRKFKSHISPIWDGERVLIGM